MNLKGTLSNLHPETYLPYINSLISPNLSALSGTANLSFNIRQKNGKKQRGKFYVAGNLEDFFIARNSKNVVVNLPGGSKLRIKGKYDKSKLSFNYIYIKSKNANIQFRGKILNYRTKRKFLI